MTTPMRNPDFVYKIVSPGAFDAGGFPRMPIDLEDGYIHLSTAAQLAETLRLYFAGQSVVVFAVRCYDLGAGLRWEPSRGGAMFPHHYGDLDASAIGERATVSVAADGSVTLPAFVK